MEAKLLRHLAFLLLILFVNFSTSAKLEPTQFINNRVYALLNQHIGNYLSLASNGEVTRTHDKGDHTNDQLWRVKAINKDGFKLVNLNANGNEGPLDITWRPVYVGHGKYQLQKVGSEDCLAILDSRITVPCNRENDGIKWYPTLKKDI